MTGLPLLLNTVASVADPARRSIALNQFAVGVTHERAGLHIAAGECHVGDALCRVANLGLDLLLNLTAKAVRVGEADLNLGLRTTLIEEMRFSREGRGKGRLAGAAKALKIIDDTSGRFAQE